MNFQMQKAVLLAESIKGFIQFVQSSYENKYSFRINTDKLYKVKLITEDFKFHIIADELLRINQYDWDEKYTYYLVNQFREGFSIIDEYVTNNYDDLFLITARIHTLKNLSSLFSD
ncbi:MAG: hypothetical protein AB2392_03115 [Neobacillus sp.]|jgi:hypothetical protein